MMYRVMWEVDIEAHSPREAALQALLMQRDPTSIATVFDIYHNTSGMFMESVDLENKGDNNG